MNNEKELPKRRDIRLKNYDYSSPGGFFLTICTLERRNYFLKNVGAFFERPRANKVRPYGFDCCLNIRFVGEDIILPLFIKIALRFARAVEDACPYGFDCFSKINACRGGYYPPDFYKIKSISISASHPE